MHKGPAFAETLVTRGEDMVLRRQGLSQRPSTACLGGVMGDQLAAVGLPFMQVTGPDDVHEVPMAE
jgi:hypothetical protein